MNRDVKIPAIIIFSFIVLYVFILSHCSYTPDTIKTSYTTAEASKMAYDVAMKTAASLYHTGKINDIQKAEIIKIAKNYKQLHNTMVAALEVYITEPSREEEFTKAYMNAMVELTKLIKLTQIE